MRPGHAAGGAHRADALPHIHGLAHLHIDGAQVAHHAQQAAAMVQPHGVAVEKIVSGVDHPCSQWREYGRAGRCRNVHAAVWIAGLAVEHAAQPECAGTPARDWHLHRQAGWQRELGMDI